MEIFMSIHSQSPCFLAILVGSTRVPGCDEEQRELEVDVAPYTGGAPALGAQPKGDAQQRWDAPMKALPEQRLAPRDSFLLAQWDQASPIHLRCAQ
ncbi:hypothetical protein [Nannocystis punicea]|uniref:Uncharacterized protein n=1 Tax=Nannocystis punicea TaxID=2995304 RepID=A0ABY7GW19_9BACT|nr:hypothetical protein [Nannocystis poenicansa]WAS91170.1 hypothetical protein O0S08_33705 [Nannocystis poenicansa]